MQVSLTAEVAETKMVTDAPWQHEGKDKKGKQEGESIAKSFVDPFTQTIYLSSKNILTTQSEELKVTLLVQRVSLLL